MKKTVLAFFAMLAFLSCRKETGSTNLLSRFVPPNAYVVLKTTDLTDFSEVISKNSLLGKNDFPMRSAIETELKVIEHLNVKDENLICFSVIGRQVVFALITENRTGLIPTELQAKMNENFQYDGQSIQKYKIENFEWYTTILDDVFIGSGSKLIVENVIRLYNLGLKQNVAFENTYKMASGNASLFIDTEHFDTFYRHFFPKGNASFLKNYSNWSVLDISLEEDGIFLNGILPDHSEVPNKLKLFKGLQPQKTELAQICPMNAIGFFSFGYNDFPILKKNLQLYRKKSVGGKMDGLFASAHEIGVLYFPEGEVVALNSKAVEKTEAAILPHRKEIESFRGNMLYSFFKKDAFATTFYPLITTKNVEFYTRLNHFFIFSEHKKLLENIIANYQNGTVVSAQKYYTSLRENLSEESSIFCLGVNENLKYQLTKTSQPELRKELENFDLNNYKLSGLQLIRDEKFTQINIALNRAENTERGGVSQLFALELESPLAGKPQFFEYWRTGEQYIVAQDNKNLLYLFDNHGKLLWKKPLNERILGEIKPVDLYKNTRLQLAFATRNKFYVLGVDGSEVSPFPLKFDAPITQPLAIFDYSGSRDYRFVIVQDKKVSMWDNQGKKVKGFEFTKAKSSVAGVPKHFRIGTKDYIVIPEVSGKLHILSRQGKARINVEKELHFSENPWFLFNGKFTSTNEGGNLIQIDENGKVSIQELELQEESKIAVLEKTFVSLSENILSINNEKIELDYGKYTSPKIFEIGKKTYISLTDLQASKVYLFDEKGNSLPGFPVYGNSGIDLQNQEGKMWFTVKGENDRVLVYRF